MSRNRALPAVAAVAVLAALLWFLFGRDPGAPPPETGGPRGAPPAASSAPAQDGRAAPADSLVPGTGAGPGAAAAPGTAAAPAKSPAVEDRIVRGTAALEDGTPLAGVRVEGPGNNLPGPLGEPGLSNAAGAFWIHASPDPVLVRFPYAELVAVEGGAIADPFDVEVARQEFRSGTRVRVDSDRVRLTFRDIAGTAQVRLVNAESGVPVTDTAGLKMSWEFEGGALVIGQPEDPGLGGWIPIREGRLPEAGGVDPALLRIDPAKVTLALALPGYETARLPLPEVRGRREVRVNPVDPDARGMLEEPSKEAYAEHDLKEGVAQDQFVPNPIQDAHLRSLDNPPQKVPSDLLGMPRKFGPFALYGLPDGAWELEVAGCLPDGTLIRGRKAFERRGGTAGIGTIVLQEGGVLRVKVVDAAEKPMPQAFVIAVRPDEEPDQGRPFYPDAAGKVTVADLEPGVQHRVQVRGLPRLLEQTVAAAPAAEAKEAEFRWPEKLVHCRITLVVDGKVVANPDGSRTIPASIHESALPRDRGAWSPDGTFEADLVPGTYRFSAYATPKEGTGLALFAGEITVPSGDTFETRLELQRAP